MAQRWLPRGYSNYNDLLTAAVEAAVSDPEAPASLSTWKYGRAFPVVFSHPFWGRVPLIKNSAGTGPTPQSGNAYTVLLNDRTSVKTKGGFFGGGTNYGVTAILRGLNLEVEGRGDGTNLVAEKIRFNDTDLRTARTVEANVTPVENLVGRAWISYWPPTDWGMEPAGSQVQPDQQP